MLTYFKSLGIGKKEPFIVELSFVYLCNTTGNWPKRSHFNASTLKYAYAVNIVL